MDTLQDKTQHIAFQEAISHFQQQADQYKLRSDIKAYRAQGKQRDARNYQVLVHPNFAFDQAWTDANLKKGFPKELLIEWNLRYYRSIINTILQSPENTIIIHDDQEVARDITQLHPKIIHSSGGVGLLRPDELRSFFKLTEGVHPEDTFDIHGSVWGRCPDAFSIQLYIASQLGGYTSRKKSGYIGYYDDNLMDTQMRQAILDLEELPVRNIQTGVQHNTSLSVQTKIQSSRFMDDNSVIIPSPEEVKAVGVE